MAKHRAAHLAPYQFRSSQPVVVRQTRTIVKKAPKAQRRRSSGGGMGIGTLIMAEIAYDMLLPMAMKFLPVAAGGGSPLASPQVMFAFAADFMKADKYVKGLTLLAKVKAVDTVMSGGGLASIFAPHGG